MDVAIDCDLAHERGPIVEGLAKTHHLDLTIPRLDATVVESDEPSIWDAIGQATAEHLAEFRRGGSPRLDAFKYVRVEVVGGSRLAVADRGLKQWIRDRSVRLSPTTYDKLKWHLEGDFPAGRSPSQGFVHIGLYLTWLIQRDLIDPRSFRSDDLAAVHARMKLGTELRNWTDGALVSDMLSPEGERFSDFYYLEPSDGGQSRYLEDFGEVFGSAADTYQVPDSWDSYDLIAPLIDNRHRQWRV